ALEELRDRPVVGWSCTRFHIAALRAHVILQEPLRVVESSVDAGVHVLLVLVTSRVPPHHQLISRHDQVDPNMVMLAVPLVPMRHLNHHMAARDSLREALELGGARSYVVLDGLARRDTSK